MTVVARGIPACSSDAPCVPHFEGATQVGGTFAGCLNPSAFYRDPNGRLAARTLFDDADEPRSQAYLFREPISQRLMARQFNCEQHYPSTKTSAFYREGRQRMGGVVSGGVFGSPTVSEFDTDLIADWSFNANPPPTRVGCWPGYLIRFTTGKNRNQWREIATQNFPVSGSALSATVVVDTPLPFAPEAGDQFIIQRVRRTPLRSRLPVRRKHTVTDWQGITPPPVTFDGRPYDVFRSYELRLKRDSIIGTPRPGTPTWDPVNATVEPNSGDVTWFPDSFFNLLYDISESPTHGIHMHWHVDQVWATLDLGMAYGRGTLEHLGCLLGHNDHFNIDWRLWGYTFGIQFPHLQGFFDFNGTDVLGVGIKLGIALRIVGIDPTKDPGTEDPIYSFPLTGNTNTLYHVAWEEIDTADPAETSSIMDPLTTQGFLDPPEPGFSQRPPPITLYETPCSLSVGRVFSEIKTGATNSGVDYSIEGDLI